MNKLVASNSSAKSSPSDHWAVTLGKEFVGHITKVQNTRDVVHPYKIYAGVGDKVAFVGSTLGPLRLAVAHLEKVLGV